MQLFQRRHVFMPGVITSLLLAIVFLRPPLSTAEPQLKLQRLIEEAEQQNPEIQVARQRWEAAKALIPQVQSLPDPIIGFAYRGPDIMREGRIAFQQEFPFFGKLGLRGQVAGNVADQVREEYKATGLRVLAQLQESYYTLHFIHKSLEIVGKNIKILDEFEKTAEARYKVGKGIQQDLFRAQVELSRELERLTTLEQEKETLHADINRLVNRPPAAPLGTPEEVKTTPVPYSLDQLNEQALQHSPLLKAQVKGVESGKSALDLAHREYYPDFFVGLGAMQSFRSSDLTDAFGTLGIKVPLYYGTKQRYGVEEALAVLEGARKNYQRVSQDLLFRVKDNFARAERATKLSRLLEHGVIPQASLALESSMAGYSVGKVDFLTMLDNLLKLQQDELDLHRERVAHEVAFAKLEEAVGIPLTGEHHE
jgi:outer membrane protein, heavy metal efflux system